MDPKLYVSTTSAIIGVVVQLNHVKRQNKIKKPKSSHEQAEENTFLHNAIFGLPVYQRRMNESDNVMMKTKLLVVGKKR